ncbi:MAG: STAS domain-containing protein [Gammaproteobacteria bacterium]|nr:STAS domain-containing protein [Gammaproteobacteria bacterium]NIR84550.1 STAS domain-containing protein [Gammaproteobacteria bacterium]NIR90453.1 STAS domain-containing protein [Gammaproteobacteria bacterium]NIU05601.1 STAS domain-containing protein [Gammaproteobacteria bacterium]NIV52740.1 STAS domain-containing protein [Gammaproteobacteria bacterium]
MSEVVRSRIGLVTYLAPPGSLTERSDVATLSETMDACIKAGDIHLVLDLVNVTLVNSVALEALLDTQDRVTRIGGDLQIAHANATIRDVFKLTGLQHYISLADQKEPSSGSDASVQPLGPEQPWRLGERLIERGLVNEEAINGALEVQRTTGKRLGDILLQRGLLKETDLLAILSEQFMLPFVHLRPGLFDPDVVNLLNSDIAKRLRVAPLFKVRGALYLACADPHAIPSFDTVEELTRCKTRPVLASTEDILDIIGAPARDDYNLSEYIGQLDSETDFELVDGRIPGDFSAIDEMASGSPVINLVNGLVQRAIRDGASDIHVEPSRARCRIRFRIDGVLYQTMELPIEIHPSMVSRLKVMANLDIAERRMPQDGRMQVYTQGRTIDLRFSSLPGIFGEKVVLRVLDKARSVMDIDRLGLSDANLATFRRLLHYTHGLILVTGPTGSGKTTTLYAGLNYLNSIEKSIVTIEDPVEYQLDLVNQNQIKDDIGLGFAKMLKHVLRQDPDVVMVGEIRERETAQIAVQAALTGHLVLSTLHTNDAAGVITRLLDMRVEPFLLSSALIGVMSQRLVRTVCPECKTSYVASPESLSQRGLEVSENVRLARGRGCPSCYDSGYKGRIAIHEIFECDTETQRLMVSNPSRDTLARHIDQRGIKSLYTDGIAKAFAGKTTLDEVTRVIHS